MKKRVLFIVTMHTMSNRYSLVGYELTKYLAKKSDIKLTIFGLQNFTQIFNHRTDFPDNVEVYDAWANENPKKMGFGLEQVTSFVTRNRPDVVIIYNDMYVLTNMISQLQQVPNKQFKIIAYIDQVYLNQKPKFIETINKTTDLAILFTPYWEEIAKKQGITIPTCYLRHGLNSSTYYPISKTIARMSYKLNDNDFVILNLNRNQPRKRWDICIQAFVEVIHRFPNEPIVLLIGTELDGAWNLLEIFERELVKREMTLEFGMKHILLIEKPQQLSDADVNLLYNAADIGINTCDGEGFGLCNFQHAAIGKPQIVPYIGGFRDYFDTETSLLITPKINYYVDNTRDMVCGEAEMCDFKDFADAIIKYYTNRDLLQRHGINGREKILRDYSWDQVGEKLYYYISETVKNTNHTRVHSFVG
jgi:glycosyltransferase involved in cell wall biosynthesis